MTGFAHSERKRAPGHRQEAQAGPESAEPIPASANWIPVPASLIQSAKIRPADHAASPGGEIRRARKSDSDMRGLRQAALSRSSVALPFAREVQAAFGRYDVSAVRAHTDEGAAASTRAMGARAFTSGGSVAFARTPDLFTVAHEAAHVIQQRSGVSLPGGIGLDGDAYERQADAVGRAVVAGRSAEPLLDTIGAAGVGSNRGTQGVSAHTAIQLLTLGEEKDLEKYIRESIDNMDGLYVTDADILAKVEELSAAYTETRKKNGIDAAKAAALAWLEVRQAQKLARQSTALLEAKKLEDAKKDQEEQKEEIPTDKTPMPSTSEPKQPRSLPMSVGEFHAKTPTTASKKGYGQAANKGKKAATPLSAPKGPELNTATLKVIKGFNAWSPVKPGGCSGMSLTLKDLQSVLAGVNQTKLGKYSVFYGEGSGEYAGQWQLKFAHQQQTDNSTGKKITYHVSAKKELLEALGVGQAGD